MAALLSPLFMVATCLAGTLGTLASLSWLGILWPEAIVTTTSTSTTVTRTSTTATRTSTTTPATTPLPSEFGPIYGGDRTQANYKEWLRVWRNLYTDNEDMVPELDDSMLPSIFKGVKAKVVVSSGGVASGVVSEGMGYALLIEGMQAAAGDEAGIKHGLALMRAWLGMVYGPSSMPHPFGGGTPNKSSATDVKTWPYGVSAIEGQGEHAGPMGMATWKYPLDLCKQGCKDISCLQGCSGAAADADQDAVMGIIYLTAVLKYPKELVDIAMRGVISFASADLGFPDLYRTLPDRTKVFVPKCGSTWGGLVPPGGTWHTSQKAWCYSPGYFAPAHYRTLRDFAAQSWQRGFDAYLPPHLDGGASTLAELLEVFNGAVTAGYNILNRSSCSSGAVSNWVGVKASCEDDDQLSCSGVPWANTPYVGDQNGTCNASGTHFGSWGPDASRAMWRIAMDYALYTAEALSVPIYDDKGKLDIESSFNAKIYLNRISRQYKKHARCDGSVEGECIPADTRSPWLLSFAFDKGKRTAGELEDMGLTCSNVPNAPEPWWSQFMAYPTFTAFIAPTDDLTARQSTEWMETFASICEFTDGEPKGSLCAATYFEASQELIATMIVAGGAVALPKPPARASTPDAAGAATTAAPKAKPTPAGHLRVGDHHLRVVDDADESPKTRPRAALALGLTAGGVLAAIAAVAEALRQSRAKAPEEEEADSAKAPLKTPSEPAVGA